MNCCNKNEEGKNSHGKNNPQMGVKDMLKMAACCGGPLAGAAILGAFGINASFLLALACPLMMGYMMWMMGRMQSTEDPSSQAKVPGVAREKSPREEAQNSGESRVNEEKVQTTVVTEIKSVPVSPNGAKGERESYGTIQGETK